MHLLFGFFEFILLYVYFTPYCPKNRWEAVTKYGTMRKRMAYYSWLNMRSLRNGAKELRPSEEHTQKQRLNSTTEILFIGKERI